MSESTINIGWNSNSRKAFHCCMCERDHIIKCVLPLSQVRQHYPFWLSEVVKSQHYVKSSCEISDTLNFEKDLQSKKRVANQV